MQPALHLVSFGCVLCSVRFSVSCGSGAAPLRPRLAPNGFLVKPFMLGAGGWLRPS